MSSRGDSDDFARGYGTRAGAAYSTRTPPPNDAEASPSRSLGSVSWRNTPAGVSDLDTPNSESVFSPHKIRRGDAGAAPSSSGGAGTSRGSSAKDAKRSRWGYGSSSSRKSKSQSRGASSSAAPSSPSRGTAGYGAAHKGGSGGGGGGAGRGKRDAKPSSKDTVTVSRNFVAFVCAGLAFFGFTTVMGGHHNRAFERHFQEMSKVKADRRALREENEWLRRENQRLRGLSGGGRFNAPPPPPQQQQQREVVVSPPLPPPQPGGGFRG